MAFSSRERRLCALAGTCLGRGRAGSWQDTHCYSVCERNAGQESSCRLSRVYPVPMVPADRGVVNDQAAARAGIPFADLARKAMTYT